MRSLMMLIVLLLVAPVSADELIISEWLIQGPVPFEDGADPFDTPPSAALLAAAPTVAESGAGLHWTRGRSEDDGLLDLIGRGFDPEEICSAYLLAYVLSTEERTATLSVGSDDGIQVFVNGTEVHRNWALRGWEADQDAFPVRLAVGWNRVLLRVANYTGGFGGSARFVEGQGLRAVAARPSDYEPARTAALLDLTEASTGPKLVAGADGLPALQILVGVRNLGTDAAEGATLNVFTTDEALDVTEPITVQPGAGTLTLLVDAETVAQAVASGASLRLQLDNGDRTLTDTIPAAAGPRELLPIVTGEVPLREYVPVPREETERLLDDWTWGARFRPDLFDDDSGFRTLVGSFLDEDAEAFDVAWQDLHGRVESAAEEIKRQRITFTGNSHIDMAWLWDRDETIEVVDMTYDQALKFIREFPFFNYAQSQMQTYQWVEELFPRMMERIDAVVAAGSWLPVGGMWVEPDCNLPSGESFVRQLVYGKGWVRDRWGIDIKIGWNPDSFGYAHTLPMIFKGAGIDYFITQKIGWNDTTEFPHRLFWWKAPDGSRVLSYFPFTYVDDARPEVLAERLAQQQEQQPGLVDMLNLYGVGDHGGGPTREMIERYVAMSRIKTFPEVEHDHPRAFMERVEKKYAGEIPVWNDELYLEYHRGTYTTQGEMKRRNRRMESSLESAEKFATLAAALAPGYVYPDDEIDGAWLRTLFNQFHDILPGSSIPDVYVDARADYDDAETMVASVGAGALKALAGRISTAGPEGRPVVVFNPLSWKRSDVVCIPRGELHLDTDQLTAFDAEENALPVQLTGSELCFLAADVPGIGYRTFWIRNSKQAVETQLIAEATEGRVVVQNTRLRAEIDTGTGDLRSVVHLGSGHEMLQPDADGGNVLQLLGDIPSQWDAWNIGYTGEQWSSGEARVEIVEDGPLRVTVRATRTIGNSELVHDYVLQSDSPLLDIRTRASWDEEHKLLKTAFHLKADAEVATFEIPYGTIERATRPQTEAGKAKWEVAGNRWVDVSDRSGKFGLTVVDDSKYGYDISGQTLRLTLLRAPKYPDPKADIGAHEFAYALYPHEGGWREADSYRRGAEYNVPLEALVVPGRFKGDLPSEQPLVSTAADHVVLSALKAARDRDTRPAFILRIHEVEGRGGTVEVRFPFPIERAFSVNLMEDRSQELDVDVDRVKTVVDAYGLQSVLVQPR